MFNYIICYITLRYIKLYYIMTNVLILLYIIHFEARFCHFFCASDKKIELNSGKIHLTQNSVRAKFRCRQPL